MPHGHPSTQLQLQHILYTTLIVLLCGIGRAHAALRIITETPSPFTATDPTAPRYIVALFDPAATAEGVIAPRTARPVTITNHQGQAYTCSVPTSRTSSADGRALVDPSKGPPSQAQGEEAAEARKRDPFELLELLAATPCLYTHDGQWTYEFCFKKHVRQFRQDGSKTEDFSCGEYAGDEEQSDAILEDSSASGHPVKYVTHTFIKGARCVLTNAPRTSEVRYTCARDTHENVILSVREFPTCNYVVVVSSPYLCEHPDFKPLAEDRRLIACVPDADSKSEVQKAAGPAVSQIAQGEHHQQQQKEGNQVQQQQQQQQTNQQEEEVPSSAGLGGLAESQPVVPAADRQPVSAEQAREPPEGGDGGATAAYR